MVFVLVSGRPNQSPESRALTSLFSSLVDDALNEFAYSADIAGASYSLGLSSNGLQLALGGFSHKVPELLEAVLQRAIVPFTSGGGDLAAGQVRQQWVQNTLLYCRCFLKLVSPAMRDSSKRSDF